MTECCPSTCSITPSTILEAHKGPTLNFLYSQVVGLVMYLAMDTQSNLAFSVRLVLHFASNRKEVYVTTVKRILCYLWVTTNIGLTFGGSGNYQLVGYKDANYTSCTLTKVDVRICLPLWTSNVGVEKQETRMSGILNHKSQVNFIMYIEEQSRMATRVTGFLDDFARSTNSDIPRQPIYNCLGRKRTDFL